MGRATLLWVLVTGLCAQAEPLGARDRPASPSLPQHRSFLLPALEIGALHFAFLAFNNANGQEYALVTWQSTLGTFDGSRPWTFDQDTFVTNQLGHPVQGMLAHAAARSAGHGFWTASAYTFMSSLAWELFFEPDRPSINDQITTALGGALLGEAMHRLFRVLVDRDDPDTRTLRELTALVLSPTSAVNRWLFDDRFGARPGPPRGLYAHAGVGATFGPRILTRQDTAPFQGGLVMRLRYGGPSRAELMAYQPFEHHELELSAAAPVASGFELHLRGLVAGSGFRTGGDRLRGLWGLYGQYDMSMNEAARISGVGVGLGTELDATLGAKWSVQGAAMLSLLGAAASGVVDPEAAEGRDYLLGPGSGLLLSARLVRQDLGMLGLHLRRWRVAGVWTEPFGRFEDTTHLTAEMGVMLTRALVLGVQAPLTFQRVQSGGVQRLVAADGIRLTLGLATDGAFGTAR